MILGFKRRFAPFVEEGSKTHSFRLRSKRPPPKIGETLHCYVDPRQKSMRLLGRFRCVRVEEMTIHENDYPPIPLQVEIEHVFLTADEADTFFERDGFRDRTGETHQHMHQAYEFWEHKFPADGFLIHWEFKPGTASDKPKASKRRAGGKT